MVGEVDIAVLSPHLDDAVLSLGGLIGREAAVGHRVEVITCFTAGPPVATVPAKRRVFADYTARRAEDERALAVMGAAHRWLDLWERSWREPPLPRPLQAFRTPPDIAAFAELTVIREVIGKMLDRGALVYAPLGVGNHVDHVEVALAAMSEMVRLEAFSRVRFYEDSYAMSRLPCRRHFVTRRHVWPRSGAPAWASPRIGAMLWLIGLAARGPGPGNYLSEAARLDWTSQPAPLSVTDEERRLTAAAEYGSQVKTFGGIDRVRRFLRRGHRTLGGERIWTCQPGGSGETPAIAARVRVLLAMVGDLLLSRERWADRMPRLRVGALRQDDGRAGCWGRRRPAEAVSLSREVGDGSSNEAAHRTLTQHYHWQTPRPGAAGRLPHRGRRPPMMRKAVLGVKTRAERLHAARTLATAGCCPARWGRDALRPDRGR